MAYSSLAGFPTIFLSTSAFDLETTNQLRNRNGRPPKNPLSARQSQFSERAVGPRVVKTRGIGKDAFDGFLDLSKLVSSDGLNSRSLHEKLADRIGQDIYADFGGWHLYLRDMRGTPEMKLSQVLANAIGSKLAMGNYKEQDIEDLLKSIPVSLGGGKEKVSLYQVLPNFCVKDLVELCTEYAREL
mmetsp:Transcript_25578/g.60849  ORF Transcript_25578/g.60849 Transcript_25578/m.60849 type:complete len:186 (-) Transcript_25578:280-837(-)|eukprot:CAMPEP_0177597056 /NCGR_PEP_ID=MMETSP0419_2-20121207/11486_1 /TAXON_ID=582737 /ORGANISM="Tetraselmis sp., Strain GSL018" /LENGTH=185 /DNA_ID=CAMNT_0019089157 /DNA_START=103 /DNA_END=660 /DNA_ORIENTATION=+